MTGYNKWNFKPYAPYDRPELAARPCIRRIAPSGTGVALEWFHSENTGPYTLIVEKAQGGDRREHTLSEKAVTACNLDPDTDYKFYICAADGTRSEERLARTGFVPGAVVNYLHPDDPVYAFSGRCICSPSLVRLPSGALLASMDVYGAEMPQNLTFLFRSDDEGVNWRYVTDLFPCCWGKLFMHRGGLYMLACSTEFGDLLIGRSEDEGASWTTPTVIFRGACNARENGWQKAPNNIINAHGRLWTSVEYGSRQHKIYSNGLLSIDETADLLQAENWRCTELYRHDPACPGALNIAGAIEGEPIALEDGSIINLIRYAKEKIMVLRTDPDRPEEKPSFIKIADFPMGHTKFEIKRHKNGLYYAVGNRLPLRNILSVYVSGDLDRWEFLKDILNYAELSERQVGFQYPSWFFEGDEMLILCRTAFNGARSYHDNNYITFHRVRLQ